VILLIIFGAFLYLQDLKWLKRIAYAAAVFTLLSYVGAIKENHSTLGVAWQLSDAIFWPAIVIHIFSPKRIRTITNLFILVELLFGIYEFMTFVGQEEPIIWNYVSLFADSFEQFMSAVLFRIIYDRTMEGMPDEEDGASPSKRNIRNILFNRSSKTLLLSPLGIGAAACACAVEFFSVVALLSDWSVPVAIVVGLDTIAVALLIIFGIFGRAGYAREIAFYLGVLSVIDYAAAVIVGGESFLVTWEIMEGFIWMAVAMHFNQHKAMMWIFRFFVATEALFGVMSFVQNMSRYSLVPPELIYNLAYSFESLAIVVLFYAVYRLREKDDAEEEISADTEIKSEA